MSSNNYSYDILFAQESNLSVLLVDTVAKFLMHTVYFCAEEPVLRYRYSVLGGFEFVDTLVGGLFDAFNPQASARAWTESVGSSFKVAGNRRKGFLD